ncbi:unnamed protein product [Effrenium voratum]|uniref:Uncharacterized protein n=1 Tax=Effrenium voratum TaxID=2562239 RepID=A0AA36MM57_9DINO|nr:unnamed protein product [Effrenium voratum]
MASSANTSKSSSWKGVQDSFKSYLEDLPSKGSIASLEGPGREQVRDVAQERLLDSIISAINQDDTPEGRRSHERWSRAQVANQQVKEALKVQHFRGPVDAGGIGRNATREAAEAFFPEHWRSVLDEDEVMAELVVDCVALKVAETFLDAAAELLQRHEGWYLPATKMGRTMQRSATLGGPLASSAWANLSRGEGIHSPPQPDAPVLVRQHLASMSRSSRDRSECSQEFQESTQSLREGSPHGRTLKHFRSARPLDPFLMRLQAFTDSQRPQRRLKRRTSDPFGPKWSFPMLASHFPEHWNAMAPAKPASPGRTEGVKQVLDAEWEEEAPPGYTWLQRKLRDGQTVFPYSLASHKAFFESYKDAELRDKAEAIVPLRMTEWP